MSGAPAHAQDSIPSWIKSIAGFWSEDQISDDEFVSALQYLVENGILTIPEKQAVSEAPPKETARTETVQDGYQLKLEALHVEGKHVRMLISVTDGSGRYVSPNGEMTLKIIEGGVHDVFSEKKYLVPKSFKEYTNDVSGERVRGMEWGMTLDELKSGGAYPDIVIDRVQGDVMYRDHHRDASKITLKTTLTIKDESFENEVELRHLPIHEGFFNKDTGFVDVDPINKPLDLGPFYVTAMEGGTYMADNKDERLAEFYRINLKTQFQSVSGAYYKINEIFLVDGENNRYLEDPDSAINSNRILKGDFSYVLFEEIPRDASELKLTIRVSEVETDVSEKHYEDTIEFSLK